MSLDTWGRQLASEAATPPAVITPEWFAAHTDISCVQAAHTEQDVARLAASARDHGFVSAHVLPHWVPRLRELLAGCRTLAGAPVSFPSGGATTTTKIAEALDLLEAGAQELDVVVNIGRLRSGDYKYVHTELTRVVAAVEGRAPLRVILELAYLDRSAVSVGCDLAIEAGAQYVKTGTGWSGRATTVDDVHFIAAHVQGAIAIKAAGGIRDLSTVRQMVDAGVVRFGVNAATAEAICAEARMALQEQERR
jgi:deoxyribose-phosphate aldolase